MTNRINFQSTVDNNGHVTITGIQFNDELLAKRFAHFIHVMLETDDTTLSVKDVNGDVTVEELVYDDNDFFMYNSWMDDEENLRWQQTLY